MIDVRRVVGRSLPNRVCIVACHCLRESALKEEFKYLNNENIQGLVFLRICGQRDGFSDAILL